MATPRVTPSIFASSEKPIATSSRAFQNWLQSDLTQYLSDIVIFARNKSGDIPNLLFFHFLNHPTLTFWFPISEFSSSCNRSNVNLCHLVSTQLHILVCPYQQREPKGYHLVHVGDKPAWIDENYQDITEQFRFLLATLGSIKHYYETEYQSTLQSITHVAKNIRSPQEFRDRMNQGEWQTPISLWSAWIQLKLSNERIGHELNELIHHSMVKLETLHYVTTYLKRSMLEPMTQATMAPKQVTIAIHARHQIARIFDQLFELLHRSTSLDSIQEAISGFGSLQMVDLLDPPLPEDIMLYINHLIILVQRIEGDILTPIRQTFIDQETIDQEVAQLANQLTQKHAA